MRIGVVSLFPSMLREAMTHGVLGRAVERGVVEVEYFDPREHTVDVHRTVDDRPYGGGPGMVLKVEPLRDALRAAQSALPPGSRRVYLGADGVRFEQKTAREACEWPGLILVAGRYEGVDERFIESEIDEQWSIGDYVLTGGELPALVVIDAIARLLPGTLGSPESAVEESFTRRTCSIGRTTRGRRRSTAARCLKCWHPAITPRSGAGDCSRRSGARGCGGRSFSSGAE